MGLTDSQEKLLRHLTKAALEIGEGGRALTPLIGELSACRLLGLTWEPTTGFDARDTRGKRFQIKTRKSWTTAEVNPSGRVGRFGRKDRYQFDYGILVELNDHFGVKQVWRLTKKRIMELEAQKTKGRGLHVSEVRSMGKKVYPQT